ncbi:MAG: alpha/beta fold hydrolase [Pseudomonadota bacterium]
MTLSESAKHLAIDESTFRRSVRLFERFQQRLNIELTVTNGEAIEGATIFAINPLAEFETFIPQYLLYRWADGGVGRSVIAASRFRADEPLGEFLAKVGVIPDDTDNLLDVLAYELLHGRKAILPLPTALRAVSGRHLDDVPNPDIAARLSLLMAQIRERGLRAHRHGEMALLHNMSEHFGFAKAGDFVAALERDYAITPVSIGLFPTGVNIDLLRRGASYLYQRQSVRLRDLFVQAPSIESGTEIFVHIGASLDIASWPETLRWIYETGGDGRAGDDSRSMAENGWEPPDALIARATEQSKSALEESVPVSLNQIALRLLLLFARRGVTRVSRLSFQRVVYLAVKQLQSNDANAHMSVMDPDRYESLLSGHSEAIERLIDNTEGCSVDAEDYVVAPVADEADQRVPPSPALAARWEQIDSMLDDALAKADSFALVQAQHRFDDEQRRWRLDNGRYAADRYREINEAQTATQSSAPFLLVPEGAGRGLGIVIVHGFLSSPAEMRPLANRLADAGYPVLGVRLRGHGTSPWDLRDRAWTDWYESVGRGVELMRSLCDRTVLVGFSTGGALALRHAADHSAALHGLVALSPATKFLNPGMNFVPFVHGANRLVRWASSSEGVWLFSANNPQHPDINYQHIPVRALNELRKMSEAVVERLGAVSVPTFVAQGDKDPVIDPASAQTICDALTDVPTLNFTWVRSDVHDIVYEDVDGLYDKVLAFIDERSTSSDG